MASEEIGPDSRFSWIMVIGCFIINSVTYGMIRSQGVYYLNVIGNYNVSRAEASWPFSICVALTSLNGPLAGALCQRYGSRKTVLVGIVLAALGMSLAFFANSVPELIAYVGVIHGFGLGLCMTPVPITINQYFVKARATAQGVAFSGSTIMSFALPALLTYFVDEYGLRGAFLLGGGIVLNGAIGGVIIRTPPWLCKKTKAPPPDRTSTNIVAAAVLASERMSNVVGPASPSLSTKKNKGSGIAWESAKTNEAIEIRSPDSNDLVDQELEAEEAKYGAHYKPVDPVDDVFDTNRSSLRDHRKQKPSHIMAMDSQSIRRVSSSSTAPPQPISSELFPRPGGNKVLESRVKKIALAVARKFGGAFNGFLDIAKHPMSTIIGLSWASFMFVFLTYNLIITDFVKDQGISEADSVYLYTAFSAGDLVGRLGLGWVTDKGFLKRRTFVAGALALMGALVLCQPLLGDNYVLLLTTSVFLGTIVGSTLVLFFVLYAEYLRPDQVAMAIGLNTAFNGAIMFARPVTVGFFRDALGSYSYLFYTLGGVQIGIASLWFLEPIIMRRMRPEPPKQEIASIS